MAAKSRVTVTVIFVKDDPFSPHIPCNFLYGRESKEKSGNKTIFVDDVLPVQKNKLEQNSNKYSLKKESIKDSILGFVCSNNGIYIEILFEILKHEVKLRSFSVLVVSLNEMFRGKSLILIHSRQTPHCNANIENMPKIDVRIVLLKRNLKVSKFAWLHSVDLDMNVRRKERQHKHILNGTVINNPVYTEDDSRKTDSKFSNDSMFKLILQSILWLFTLDKHGHKLAMLEQFLSYLPKYFFVAKQLSYRFSQIHNMFANTKENNEQVNATCSSKSITSGNLVISLLVDIILGFFVVYLVFSNQNYLSISSWLIGQKYSIAKNLSHLLKWLMGAPAGLKLNIPLNQFLGNFYIYHVHLWTNYLYFIEAYLPTIILCCTLAGCLGITFLLALLCDLLLLLTVHIYCFYIYAARLFSLEIHVLASLLRLFTGKKWNGLRGRVDSVEYDVDRLFIGTLLFTISLFLFPTVFLYYIVFTSLRLLVLLVQAFIYGVVALLNSFPVFGLWLYFVNPERLSEQIIMNTMTISCNSGLEDYFVIKDINTIQPDSCLHLCFIPKCLPFGNLFKNCKNVMVETIYTGIFGESVFKKLLTGQIISKFIKK